MPAATLIEIGLEKYDWQLRRKYSWKKVTQQRWRILGDQVANPRGARLWAIVATFVKEIYFSGWFSENSCTADSKYVPNLGPTMYLFYTTGLRSWNMAFLGVRSPNPLPKASGLGNLTSFPRITLLWCISLGTRRFNLATIDQPPWLQPLAEADQTMGVTLIFFMHGPSAEICVLGHLGRRIKKSVPYKERRSGWTKGWISQDVMKYAAIQPSPEADRISPELTFVTSRV